MTLQDTCQHVHHPRFGATELVFHAVLYVLLGFTTTMCILHKNECKEKEMAKTNVTLGVRQI